MVSPLLVPVWIAGLIAPLRRPAWRGLRFLPITHAGLAAAYLIGDGSAYYLASLYPALLALVRCPPPPGSREHRFGAVDLMSRQHGLPRAYSGHNAFSGWGRPSPADTFALVLGYNNPRDAEPSFTDCRRLATINDGVGLANQEQGLPVMLCRPTGSWAILWPRLRHYD
jgi:hypothetical protein